MGAEQGLPPLPPNLPSREEGQRHGLVSGSDLQSSAAGGTADHQYCKAAGTEPALLDLICLTGEPKAPAGLIQRICFRPNSSRNAGALAGKTGCMQPTKAKLWGKYLGCMLGSALGDAIGELAFRFPEEGRLRAAIAAAPVLRYTDDTAMALGLAESLAERGTWTPPTWAGPFTAISTGNRGGGMLPGRPPSFSWWKSRASLTRRRPGVCLAARAPRATGRPCGWRPWVCSFTTPRTCMTRPWPPPLSPTPIPWPRMGPRSRPPRWPWRYTWTRANLSLGTIF